MKSKQRWLLSLFAVLGFLLVGAVALSWAPDRSGADLSMRWVPPPSRYIALQGMQVHVRDEGPRDDAEPIVPIHGTSASLHIWEGWVAVLKGSRRVISMDRPAFGLTGPAADGDYSIERYAAFVLALMDRMGVRRAGAGWQFSRR